MGFYNNVNAIRKFTDDEICGVNIPVGEVIKYRENMEQPFCLLRCTPASISALAPNECVCTKCYFDCITNDLCDCICCGTNERSDRQWVYYARVE